MPALDPWDEPGVPVEEWRRLEALKAAVAVAPSVTQPIGVIEIAKRFEAYLKGDATND